MMFSNQILLFTTVLSLAVAKVPSYIHVCGAKNPKLDDCVINSVISLRDKLRVGIPELDIPPVEPLKIERIQLTDMPDFKTYGTNMELRGLLTYHIKFLHVDLKKQRIDIDVKFDETKLNAMYNVTAKILVPITGSGPISLTTNNVDAKVKITYKLVERRGEKYVYFDSMKIHLNIKDYDLTFDSDTFDKTLKDAIVQVLGSSHQEVLDATRPNVEKAISETVLNMANKICKHFTFDELLPNRE